MPSSELAEWMAVEKITGPFGSRRGDIQAAIIAAVVANANSAKKRFTAKDFIPVWDKRPKTPEELWKAAQAAFRPVAREQLTDP
ncbi:DUF4035 domain-containing protein [Streptomyces sp. CNQ085]|uniref:phage tail assembly protein T n=1 Tax=Streptomyces sp. CNQ085 TaxID=2886944 RepID=UPI001F514A63|nr:DUF4035 domain-containing protein [Streptomyces sp. CNQ085]MCI0384592.1 DUF4035 domain-containing protein [Streptomyces sp. CNQ085]